MSAPVPKPAPRPATPRKPLSRSGPVKKRRVPKRFAKRRDPKFLEWVRLQPCVIAGRRYRMLFRHECSGIIEAHHVRGRKIDDVGSVVPLCSTAHRMFHTLGRKSFDNWYSIDLTATAAALGQRYRDTVEGG